MFRNTQSHLYRSFKQEEQTYEDGTERSETSAYKIQTSGYHPKEGIQQFELFPVQ
jgi:hypothetical protein